MVAIFFAFFAVPACIQRLKQVWKHLDFEGRRLETFFARGLAMKFDGKIMVIGLGAVSRCFMPLLFKHLETKKENITVMDFADVEAGARYVKAQGANFVRDRI